MKSHLPKAPVLESFPAQVAATHYNRVRLAISHLGTPQEVMLGARGLSFLFYRDVWLCTDERLDGTPLVTWSNFERPKALHLPISCQVSFYHPYARIVAPIVLAELDQRLSARLKETRDDGDDHHVVVKMPPRRSDPRLGSE